MSQHSELFEKVRRKLVSDAPGTETARRALDSIEEQLEAQQAHWDEIDTVLEVYATGGYDEEGQLFMEVEKILGTARGSSPATKWPGATAFFRPVAGAEVVDLDAGRKVCVHCGGDAHPDECGEPDPASWRLRGLAVDEIQILLGHSSIRTTSDLYVHTQVQDVAEHMRVLESLRSNPA